MTSRAPTPERSEPGDTTLLVARTAAPFRVDREPVTVVLAGSSSTDGAVSSTAQVCSDARVLLRLSDVQSSGKPGSYDVYVNVPPGAEPQDHPDHLAGRVSPYGTQRGFDFVLDLSQLHCRLAGGPYAIGDRVRITIVPVHDWSDPVTVDSASLHLG